MTTFQACNSMQVGSAVKLEIALTDCKGEPVPISGIPLQIVVLGPGGTIRFVSADEGSSSNIVEAQLGPGFVNAAGSWKAQAIAHFATGAIYSHPVKWEAMHNLFIPIIGDPHSPVLIGLSFPKVLAG